MVRSPRLIEVLLGFVLWSSSAMAHGPVPAALGVGALDSSEHPWLVRLSEGLAFREEDGHWRYGCAQAWTLPLTPIVAQVDPEHVWLVGTEHLFRVHPLGPPEPWSGAGPDAHTILQLTPSGDGEVTATARVDGGTHLWRLTADTVTPLETHPEAWRGLAVHEDALHMVRVEDSNVIHLRLTRQGTWVSEHVLDGIDAADKTPHLHASQGGLFLSLRSASSTHLWRLEPDTRLVWEGAGQMLGPVTLRGDPTDVLVASDGDLIRIRGDGDPEIQDTPMITCLEEGPDGPYACNLRTVIPLDDETGELAAPIFDVGKILPPDPDRVPEEAWSTCELDWLDFAADGDLDPYGEVPVTTAESTSDGCSASRQASTALWMLLLWLVAVFRRSFHRAHPSPPR